MGQDKGDFLGRLRHTISNWTDEVTQAQGLLARQIAETRDQLVELTSVLDARNENPDVLQQARVEIRALRQQLREKEFEFHAARDQAEVLRKELDHRSQALHNAAADDVRTALEDAQHEIRLLLGQVQTQRDELKTAREEALELRRRIEEHAAATAASEQQQQLLSQQVKDLQGELNEALATITLRDAELEDARQRAEQCFADVAALRGTMESTEAELEQLRGHAREQSGVIEGLRAQSATAEEQLFLARETIEAIRKEQEQLQREIEQAREDSEALRMESSRLNALWSESVLEIERLRQQADNENHKHGLAAAEFAEKERRLVSERDEALAGLASVHEQLSETSQHLRNAVLERDRLAAALREAVTARENFEAEARELRQQNARAEEALKRAEGRAGELSRMITEGDARCGALDVALASVQNELADLRADTIIQREKAEAVALENARLQEMLASLRQCAEADARALSDAQAAVRDIQHVLALREQEVQELQAEHERVCQDRDAVVIERDKALISGRKAAEALKEKERELATETRRLELLANESAAVQVRFDATLASLAAAHEQIEKLSHESRSNAREAETGKHLLEQLSGEHAQLRQTHSETLERLGSIRGELERLTRVFGAKELEAAAHTSRIRELVEEQEYQKAAHAQLLEERLRLEQTIQKLSGQAAESERLLEEMAAKLARAEGENDRIQTLYRNTQAQLQDGRRQIAEMQEGLIAANCALEAASREKQALAGEGAELRDARNRLNAELKDSLKQLDMIRGQSEELRQALEETALESAATASERDRLKLALASVSDELDEALKRAAQLKQELNTAANKAEKAGQRNHELETALHALRLEAEAASRKSVAELQSRDQDRRDLEATLMKSRARISVLTSSLEARTTETETLRKREAALELSLKELQEQHACEIRRIAGELDKVTERAQLTDAALSEMQTQYERIASALREREETLNCATLRLAESEANAAVLAMDLENARKAETLHAAEKRALSEQLEALSARERTNAMALARARSEIAALQDIIRKHDDLNELDRQRTFRSMQRALGALQDEVSRLSSTGPRDSVTGDDCPHLDTCAPLPSTGATAASAAGGNGNGKETCAAGSNGR